MNSAPKYRRIVTGKATAKQRRFAELYASGLSACEAYRQAGYSVAKPSTVATNASRLLKNPHVAPIIKELQQASSEAATETRAALILRTEAIHKRLYEELMQSDSLCLNAKAVDSYSSLTDKLAKLCPEKEPDNTANVPVFIFDRQEAEQAIAQGRTCIEIDI